MVGRWVGDDGGFRSGPDYLSNCQRPLPHGGTVVHKVETGLRQIATNWERVETE